MKKLVIGTLSFAGLVLAVAVVFAASGDLLDTVPLAGNSGCNVGIAFDGTYVMAVDDGCPGTTIGIHTPGTGALIATKTVKDAAGALVTISAIDWDSSRGKLWAAYNGPGAVYLIDLGDKTVDGDVVAVLQFSPAVGGNGLVDGLAWDSSDDTLYYSPDVDCDVFQFSPAGVLLNTVTPKDAAGVSDCDVSGVAIGSANSLYIGRNGNNEIRRVDKTTGAFVSTFATTAGRVEDLVCDPVTYAPLEAVLAKDAFSSLYEAFEVETGTCPFPDTTPPEVACVETVNPAGKNVPTAPAKGGQGQNQDGYYEVSAKDDVDPNPTIHVVDRGPDDLFPSLDDFEFLGPFANPTKVKYTEANGATPSQMPGAGVITWKLKGRGDMVVYAVDAAGNKSAPAYCLVPNPPK